VGAGKAVRSLKKKQVKGTVFDSLSSSNTDLQFKGRQSAGNVNHEPSSGLLLYSLAYVAVVCSPSQWRVSVVRCSVSCHSQLQQHDRGLLAELTAVMCARVNSGVCDWQGLLPNMWLYIQQLTLLLLQTSASAECTNMIGWNNVPWHFWCKLVKSAFH